MNPLKLQRFLLSSLFLYLGLLSIIKSAQSIQARLPPRGWNSYDSFCWTISEEEFFQSADIISRRLLPHGYEFVVVDYLWYRRKVPGASVDSHGFDVIDEWGRVMPDPDRWPSSKGGTGFIEVAKRVHNVGLKFGIHVMRGMSKQAYDANTPILDPRTGIAFQESGRIWHAKDIAIPNKPCTWMKNGFMSVDTTLEAGRAYLRSLYHQYAEWGVDYVKHDCVFGEDFDINEITYVSEILQYLERPIVYSLSPGTSVTPSLAKTVSSLVNVYRVTGDDWDSWSDVASHFEVARDFSSSNMIGDKGLHGRSWPDLDMLPFGWLTDPGSNNGPHRSSNLNWNEQRTQMTLWAMAKSPLMFGGDVRVLDNTTYSILTDPVVLEINFYSSNNKEFARDEVPAEGSRTLSEVNSANVPQLSLINCKDPKARSWSMEPLDEDVRVACWKDEAIKRACLKTQMESNGNHVFANDEMELCLEASSWNRRTSMSFSPCNEHAHQLWTFQEDGTLVSNHSGLCAAATSVRVSGTRSWIATGRTGDVYVALFNLNDEAKEMRATLLDMRKTLPRSIALSSCHCREVWSGEDYGVVKDSISVALAPHGCALLAFRCL